MWFRRARDRLESRDRAPPGKKPTPDDFTGKAVTSAVFWESIQHPATILPWAGALVALGYSAMIDVSPASFMAVLAGAFFGGASLAFNWLVRGDRLAERHVQQLRERRDQWEVLEVEAIEEDCRKAGFVEGAKEAAELTSAYVKLRDFLKAQLEHGQNLSAERFLALAQDTYQQGVANLRRGLLIFQSLQQIDAATLDRERKAWDKQRSKLASDASERRELDRKIEAHDRRIELCRQHDAQLQQLIAESNDLETALETAYLQVTDLVGSGPDRIGQGDASTQLERAVQAARRVEDRLRGLGNGAKNTDDDMYLKIGQSAHPQQQE